MSTNTMSKPNETGSKKLFTKEWLIEQKSLIALLFLIVVVSFLNPNFFTVDNILNILRQTSVNAIIAVGMTLVILTAGIDLSVGSVLALCGAFAASMIALEVPVLIAVPTALFAGAALGAIPTPNKKKKKKKTTKNTTKTAVSSLPKVRFKPLSQHWLP